MQVLLILARRSPLVVILVLVDFLILAVIGKYLWEAWAELGSRKECINRLLQKRHLKELKARYGTEVVPDTASRTRDFSVIQLLSKEHMLSQLESIRLPDNMATDAAHIDTDEHGHGI
jgi:hypothetical protein